MSFSKGDVVQLKSGGPLMTVTGIVGVDINLQMATLSGYVEGDVSVEYFKEDKLKKKMFKASSIKLIAEES